MSTKWGSGPNVQNVPNDALSYAYGGQLDLRLLEGLLSDGVSIADLKGTEQAWRIGSDDPQDAAPQALDVGIVEDLISLDLGDIDLPLVGPGGLLEFVLDDADLGVIHEFANARTPNEAYGGVGLVSADGSTIDLTNNDSGKTHASVNLISLLRLNQLDVFTTEVVNTAALELGVAGSRAAHPDTPFTEDAECEDLDLSRVEYDNLDHEDLNDQYFLLSEDLKISKEDNRKFCSGYMLADAKVVIGAPLIDSITDEIGTLVGGLDGTINGLLSEDGALDGVLDFIVDLLRVLLGAVNDFEVTVGVTIPVDEILDSIINTPLSNVQETVFIDLKNGTILVDLQKIHGGDLSDLDPNTPLISSNQLTEITGAVTSLLTDSKDDNSRGLMARVDNALTGNKDSKTGGLYGTTVVIDITSIGKLTGNTTGSFKIKSSLGALLNPNSTRVSGTDGYDSDDPSYDKYYYDGSGVLGTLGTLLVSLLTGVTGMVGGLLDTLLLSGTNSEVSKLIGKLDDSDLVGQVVTGLSPVLNLVLQPLANAIVNRQFVESSSQGNLFTVSALELNVLTLAENPVTSQDESTLIRLPIATSAVMAQSWNLINLDINVAKIGDGRRLHNSGYTYDLVCEAPRWTGIEATGDDALSYDANNVGRSFKFSSGNLSLDGATGGLTTKVKVLPGSTCTVTASPGLASNKYLRPTGDTLLGRTPYTYFLDSDGTNALVSDELGPDDITETTTSGVTIDTNNDVLVDASAVGDKWKNHSFTFVIPGKATSHMVNVVHAYDIDQRDVVVKKVVEAAYPEDLGPFNFQYSVNDGRARPPDSRHGGFNQEADFRITEPRSSNTAGARYLHQECRRTVL